ncbi:MAG: ABC transporter substrate-binding protein [Betaproteobacteria bacterium]|nr:ABC transporter substrate-binding protein [Betaproteobacteria bacterium]
MTTRRDFIAGSAAITLGAAAGMPPAFGQGAKPETTSLSLGFGIDPPFAPHIVAMQKGWFRDAGFSDVKTKTFQSGNLAGEALVAGDIQLWTPGNLPPISMVHNGIPVVVVGTASVNWDVEKLTVRKDANVNTPEDLYKIKIGLFQGSTSSAFLSVLAKHYGLDERRLQVVNLPPPEQLASLVSNNVQALLCWEPWPHRALATGSTKVIHSGLTSYFQANNNQRVKVSDGRSVLVVSQEFARKSPNALRARRCAAARAALRRGPGQHRRGAEDVRGVPEAGPRTRARDLGQLRVQSRFRRSVRGRHGAHRGLPRSQRPHQEQAERARLLLYRPARGTGQVAGQGRRALEGVR